MTKGCKTWLWILLVCNVLCLMIGIASIFTIGTSAIYTVIAEIVMLIGIAMLLFKQKKVGFYVMIAVAVCSFIFNIINGINIVSAVLGAVISPAITYFFISKNKEVIK